MVIRMDAEILHTDTYMDHLYGGRGGGGTCTSSKRAWLQVRDQTDHIRGGHIAKERGTIPSRESLISGLCVSRWDQSFMEFFIAEIMKDGAKLSDLKEALDGAKAYPDHTKLADRDEGGVLGMSNSSQESSRQSHHDPSLDRSLEVERVIRQLRYGKRHRTSAVFAKTSFTIIGCSRHPTTEEPYAIPERQPRDVCILAWRGSAKRRPRRWGP